MSDSDFGPPDGPRHAGPPPGARGPGGPGDGTTLTRPQRSPLVTALVIAAAVAIVLAMTATFWTEILWFASVGFSGVFSTQVITKVVLGVVAGALTALVVWSSIHLAYRHRPIYAPSPETQVMEHYRQLLEPMRRTVTVAAPLAIGLFAGLSAATQWNTFLLWRNGENFGVADPEFGLDIGFYVFTLPWLNFVLSFLTMILALALIAAVVTHYLYGGIVTAGKTRTTHAARVHLAVLAAAIVLVRGVAFWVDRYNLAVSQSSRMTGIQYTGAHATIPAKGILAVAAVMCALLFLSAIWTRSWRLPLVGISVLAVVVLVVGNIYPTLMQSLKVSPSEKSLEVPYIERNIAATRAAYGFDKIEVEPYSAETTASQGQLRDDAATVPGIRIIDPNVVSPTFKQLEASRNYYQFADVLDVDRYQINGATQDTVIAAREIDLTGVPEGQRNWINDHTVYTHGYGLVAAKGNTRQDDGRPTFIESQIGTTGALGTYEPRIYFGEFSPTYSVVGGNKEFDYPSSEGGQVTNEYSGTGGVQLDALRRVAYGLKYREINFLLSDAVTNDSRILDHREPRERVERVAPWLTLDGNAYPAVVDGRVLWILDGYTTTDMYPYSQLSTLDRVTEDSVTGTRSSVQAIRGGQVNYVRNSVKATVDAYDGTVTLYQWDEKDPIVKAWMKIFPDTVKPLSAISGSLMEHLRYPEDLFKIQRTMLARYHETDPGTFFGAQTFWRVPDDPTQSEGSLVQPPYYLSLAMPGTKQPSFSLTSTFMPTGDRNVLSGFFAADGDAGSTDGKRSEGFGKLRLLETTSGTINGPGQVFNDMRTSGVSSKDPQFDLTLAQFITTTQQQGAASVMYGNQLTLPVGGGFLYVQPIYVQAKAAGSYPRLQAVAVAFGNKIAWAGSLDDALNDLFGGSSGAQAGDTGTNTPQVPGGTPTPSPTPTPGATPTPTPPATGGTPDAAALKQALADAQTAWDEGQAALKAGDFTKYGQAQEKLKEALARAVAASPTP